MAHLDLEFPRDIAAGCVAMLERRDEVVQLASGHEEANQRWAHARRSWAAGLAIRSESDLSRVVSLFEEVRGRANSFRFRDWLDWRSAAPTAPITATDQPLGVGDGVQTQFQLVKSYGAVNPYARPIAIPHPVSIRVAVDGVEATSGWAVSALGGLISFDTPPAASAVLTAGFTFDVPVRFDGSTLSVQWSYFKEGSEGIGQAPDISLIEVRLDGDA
ncbi:MAG: DUF2460 domain-containing protein [Pseudomonadota bacterium]